MSICSENGPVAEWVGLIMGNYVTLHTDQRLTKKPHLSTFGLRQELPLSPRRSFTSVRVARSQARHALFTFSLLSLFPAPQKHNTD